MINTTQAYTIALVGGCLLWLTTSALSGKLEAWDASGYWSLTYPAMLVLAGYLGYRFPEKTWRWPLAIMLAQALMLVGTSSDFGLLPLGLIMFSILAVPGVVIARFMAGIKLRQGQR